MISLLDDSKFHLFIKKDFYFHFLVFLLTNVAAIRKRDRRRRSNAINSKRNLPTTIFFFHPPARAPRGAESGDQQSFSRTSAQRRVIPPFVLLRVFLTTVHKRFGNSQESRSCADRCGLLLSCRRNHPTQPVTAILIYRDRLGDRKKIPRVLRSSFRKSSVSRQGCSVNS